MSEGTNKRTVKKTKKGDTMNIKVSTKDNDILTKDNEINLNIEGQKKKKTTSKNSTIIKSPIKEESEDNIERRISKLIEKNKKCKQELDTIKSNIDTQNDTELSEILSLNEKLSALEKEQISKSNENKTLLDKLKKMEEEVSKRFSNKFKISKIIERQKKSENKRDINKEIKVKEKEKTIVQNDIKFNQKEIKKLNKLIEENKDGCEQKLNTELQELNSKINILQKEIEELNKIKLKHKLCQQNEHKLKSKLNVLSSEYDFESKKGNMIETEPEKKEQTKIKNVNMTMVYGEKVRKQALSQVKNKYNSKIKLVNYKSYNFLLDELNYNKTIGEHVGSLYQNLQEKSLQTGENVEIPDFSTYLKNEISVRIDTKSPKNYLFSDKEKEVLKKLLPDRYYNNYNEKFNKVETELTEIEEKFKDNKNIKNEIYMDNIKCDEQNLKLKELGNIKANLTLSNSKNNKKIVELKKKIQMLNNDIKKEDKMVQKKEKINNIIRKKIETLKKTKVMQTEE
jgi:hypothetical protein